MSGDEGMRARVAGRERVAAATAWALTVGPVGFRCVAGIKSYTVEMKPPGASWEPLATGADAGELLRRIILSPSIEKFLPTTT